VVSTARTATMSRMTPKEMALTIGNGLLSFPVTPFDASNKFDAARYNLDWLCSYEVAGLFAAGGTGEFFSLTPAEVVDVVTTAVRQTAGRVPVLAGVGYGTVMASELAGAVERAGADGILLLPPYLVFSEQAGLAAHVEAVCKATSLGVIVYNRDNAILTEDTIARLCERCPNLVGFKDGVGDIEQMTRIHLRMGDRLTYVGGLPTAETFALPYLEMGVTTYSSAVFNFVPEFSTRFYAAVRRRDRETVKAGLRDFIMPQARLRCVDDQGRDEGDRPRFRPGAAAADRPDIRGSRGTVCSSQPAESKRVCQPVVRSRLTAIV
jgi:5-dehydro-4-deoxyglucarate dehydratase